MSKDIQVAKLLRTDTALTTAQVQKFFSETPKDKIKSRPAKGGGQWDYVAGSYVIQVLNSLFGFDWNFTITTSMEEALKTASTGTVVVQGRLEVRIGDRYIVKEQYGRKEVAFKKGTRDPLDFGNDMKAAATDAKKKCASELGLFADVYSQEDFFEATVVDETGVDAHEDISNRIKNAKTEEDLNVVLQSLEPDKKVAYASAIDHKLQEVRNGSSNAK